MMTIKYLVICVNMRIVTLFHFLCSYGVQLNEYYLKKVYNNCNKICKLTGKINGNFPFPIIQNASVASSLFISTINLRETYIFV